MKRIIPFLLALLLCLCACGKQPAPVTPTEPVTEAPTAAPTAPPATEPVTEAPTEAPTEPTAPAVGANTVQYTFTDDKQEPLLTLTAGVTVCEGADQINAYYQAAYDDLYAVCQLNTEDALRQKAEAAARGEEFTPWTVRMMESVTLNDGVTLSTMRVVKEKQGEQETEQVYAETFDMASQGRLLLGDLFLPGADYAGRLAMTEPDQLNFALTDGFLLLCSDGKTAYQPLSDLADILKPQYQVK